MVLKPGAIEFVNEMNSPRRQYSHHRVRALQRLSSWWLLVKSLPSREVIADVTSDFLSQTIALI